MTMIVYLFGSGEIPVWDSSSVEKIVNTNVCTISQDMKIF